MTLDDRLPRTARRPATRRGAAPLAIAWIAGLVAAVSGTSAGHAEGRPAAEPVSGTGVHYFTTAIVHAQETTPTGTIRSSSEIVTLSGDLSGHLLYHPTSVIDDARRTLVNTGTQIFSGTVLGSEPVILHDDRFRFEIDLETGATIGRVHLGRSSDAPHPGRWFECELEVVGTGLTAAGDATFDYSGTCVRVERP
jgi:hypothetical protein